METLVYVEDDKENVHNCNSSPAPPKTLKREAVNISSKLKDVADCRSPAPKSRPSLLALCEMSPMSKSPLCIRSPLHAQTRSPLHKPRMSVLALAEMSPMGESPSLEDNAAEAKSYAGQQALFAEVMQEIANDLKDKELAGSKPEEENKKGDEGIITKQGDVSIKEANKE